MPQPKERQRLQGYRHIVDSTSDANTHLRASYTHQNAIQALIAPSAQERAEAAFKIPVSTEAIIQTMQKTQRLKDMQRQEAKQMKERSLKIKPRRLDPLLNLVGFIQLDKQVLERRGRVLNALETSKQLLFAPLAPLKPKQKPKVPELSTSALLQTTEDEMPSTASEAMSLQQSMTGRDFSFTTTDDSAATTPSVATAHRCSFVWEMDSQRSFRLPSSPLHGNWTTQSDLNSEEYDEEQDDIKERQEQWETIKTSAQDLIVVTQKKNDEQKHKTFGRYGPAMTNIHESSENTKISPITIGIIKKIVQDRKKFVNDEYTMNYLEQAIVGEQNPFQVKLDELEEESTRHWVRKQNVKPRTLGWQHLIVEDRPHQLRDGKLTLQKDHVRQALLEQLHMRTGESGIENEKEIRISDLTPSDIAARNHGQLVAAPLKDRIQEIINGRREKRPPFLAKFVELANHKRLQVGRFPDDGFVDFHSDLWNLDDFIQSRFVHLMDMPQKGTFAYNVVVRAIVLTFYGDYYDVDLRTECALLLSELDARDQMAGCHDIYSSLVQEYEEQNSKSVSRLLHHPRSALSSAVALLRLGDVDELILHIYLRQFEGASEQQLQQAVSILNRFKCTEAYPWVVRMLMEMLDDPKWRMRCTILTLLSLYVNFEDTTSHDLPTPVENVPMAATKASTEDVTFSKPTDIDGAKSLFLSAEEENVAQLVLDRFTDVLNSDWSDQVRSCAENFLRRLGKGSRMLRWLECCLRADDFRKRVSALRTFQVLGKMSETGKPLYLRCIRDIYTAVRREACRAACSIAKDDPELLAALMDRFDDPDWRVRAFAVKALGLCGNTDRPVRELLLWYLIHEQNPAVVAEACIAVRELNIIDEQMQLALKDLADGPDQDTRQQAQEVLATLGIHSVQSATIEAQHAVTKMVKDLGTKKEIIVQIMEFEAGEMEHRLAMGN